MDRYVAVARKHRGKGQKEILIKDTFSDGYPIDLMAENRGWISDKRNGVRARYPTQFHNYRKAEVDNAPRSSDKHTNRHPNPRRFVRHHFRGRFRTDAFDLNRFIRSPLWPVVLKREFSVNRPLLLFGYGFGTELTPHVFTDTVVTGVFYPELFLLPPPSLLKTIT